MDRYKREIAIIVYPEPIAELYNGIDVDRLSVFLSDDGDSMAFAGKNTGIHPIKSYKDLEKYGPPTRVHAKDDFEEFRRLMIQ
jgi:hypothetical protein